MPPPGPAIVKIDTPSNFPVIRKIEYPTSPNLDIKVHNGPSIQPKNLSELEEGKLYFAISGPLKPGQPTITYSGKFAVIKRVELKDNELVYCKRQPIAYIKLKQEDTKYEHVYKIVAEFYDLDNHNKLDVVTRNINPTNATPTNTQLILGYTNEMNTLIPDPTTTPNQSPTQSVSSRFGMIDSYFPPDFKHLLLYDIPNSGGRKRKTRRYRRRRIRKSRKRE